MCKPVCGTCNLDCAYCYYTMKPKDLYPEVDRFMMSPEVLASYTKQYLEAQPIECHFGWQGGEPTLAGLDYYRQAVALQKTHRVSAMQRITNGLQTNGTTLDDEWCAFLAENKFLVGISLDGPPQWHDTFRRDRAGKPSFHRAWRGVELCRKHGVEFNILVTLNRINAPHAGDIYRYFVNRGIDYVQFIPILERTPDGRPTEFSCTSEQFGQFMIDVFELWAARDVGKISERLIDCVLHHLVLGRASTCCYDTKCANAHIVEFNGDVYACDHYVYKEWLLGNLMDTPLTELVASEKLADFAKLKTDLPARCRTCEFLRFCNGGCPKHHMPMGLNSERVNYFCEGLQAFFRRALPVLEQMVPYIRQQQPLPTLEQIESGNLPPLESPQPARPQGGAPTRAAAAARGLQPPANAPKRNDPCPCGSGLKYKRCCAK